MSNSALFALLLAVGTLTPGAALGQGAMELAMAGPQPHFVAAWAPKKEREAERSAVLAGRVSLDLRDVSLDAALKALTNQAGLRITYSRAVLPAGRRVTISASDIAVVTAMTEVLFRSGLDVVVDRDGALALVPCRHRMLEAEVQDSGAIAGTVTDKVTGAPLAGASVAVDGVRRSATTDAEGRYRIAGIEAGTYAVRVRYIGYAPASASVTVTAGGQETLDLELVKSVQKLDELVTVTPGGMRTEVRALATPVTVFTERDIAQQRPRTVQELFRQAVPGAVSWDNTARPENAAFSVRGASTLLPGTISQMKVVVDGIELANFDIAALDPASIDRVEVVRGPQAAAIYGSDAIGGVVQIFTKRGDPTLARPQVEAQVALGAVQTPYPGSSGVVRQSYSASVRGGGADVSYSFGAGYSHTGDWLPNGEVSQQSNPSTYGGMRFSRGIITVGLSGRYNVTNAPTVFNPELLQTGFPFYSKPLYQPSRFSNQTVGLVLGVTTTPWWQNTLTLGVDRYQNELVQTRARLTTADDTLLSLFDGSSSKSSVRYNTSVQGSFGSRLSGTLAAGVEHYRLLQTAVSGNAVSPTGTFGDTPFAYRLLTKNTGYFVQGQLGFRDALFLTAGARAEVNTNFGDSLGTPVSPRLGASYVRPLGRVTLKLRSSWGRAIRPPDPSIKLALGPTILPNLRIGPERQRGWDAGVDASLGAHSSLSLTYYDQVAENLIQLVRVETTPVPLDQFQNVGRVHNTGFEVEGETSLGLLQLRANYGYTRARIEQLAPGYTGDLRVGDQVQATPKHTAGALVSATLLVGTTLTTGLAYVGSFSQTDFVALFRCVGGTGPCLPSFVVRYPSFVKINAALWQRIAPELSGFLSVDNLTNNHAVELANIAPVMGRITTVGLRFGY